MSQPFHFALRTLETADHRLAQSEPGLQDALARVAAAVARPSSWAMSGPASLEAIRDAGALALGGLPISCDRTRKAGHDDADGTATDALGQLCNTLGPDTKQQIMPVDHLLLRSANALPAIAVVRQPGGAIDLIVIRRAFGLGPRARWVQVMDRTSGGHWLRADQLLSQLASHRLQVPMTAWQAWAGSEQFAAPLRTRLAELGLGPARAAALIKSAKTRPWRALACLDAATRMSADLQKNNALRRGRDAARFLDDLLDALHASDQRRILAELRGRHFLRANEQLTRIVPRRYWSAFPVDGRANVLEVQGCVLVHLERPSTTPDPC